MKNSFTTKICGLSQTGGVSIRKTISDLLVTWLTAGGKYLSVSVFDESVNFISSSKRRVYGRYFCHLRKNDLTQYPKRLWNKNSFEPNSFKGLNRLNLEEKIISKCPHEPVACILPIGVFALARGMCSCVCVRASTKFFSLLKWKGDCALPVAQC